MKKFKQLGFNSNYPLEIITWRIGEPVPEWISDVAKVDFIDGNGNITLAIRELNKGGYEIISADSPLPLISAVNKGCYICKSIALNEKKLFSLTIKQFNLLFVEDKK